MGRYEDEYVCDCGRAFDLEKTKIDIILRKFDINETLIKCNKQNEKLEQQLAEKDAIIASATEVIEFYGDDGNWLETSIDSGYFISAKPIDTDMNYFSDTQHCGGKRARQWLKDNENV